MITSEEYVRKFGSVCPACGSDKIVASSPVLNDAGASSIVACEVCEAEWTDVYELTGYDDLTNGPP